jgi:hypothetical protein
MSSKPPLLPTEIVARLLRVAHFDGGSVLVLCGVLAIASAWYGDFTGAIIGVLIAGAGAFELHGAGLIKAGEPRGLKWLIASQLYLLGTILSYVGWRLVSYDPAAVRQLLEPMLHTSDLQAQLAEAWAPCSTRAGWRSTTIGGVQPWRRRFTNIPEILAFSAAASASERGFVHSLALAATSRTGVQKSQAPGVILRLVPMPTSWLPTRGTAATGLPWSPVTDSSSNDLTINNISEWLSIGTDHALHEAGSFAAT